jgi:hypothetical protein
MVAVLAILVVAVRGAQSRSGAVWVSAERDPQLVSHVKHLLAAELAPDDPARVAPHQETIRYKYLIRASTIDNVVLALIGLRATQRDPARSELLAAYSVDLTSGSKRLLGKFMVWEFRGWAHFERRLTPDAVFSFQSCIECEAQGFLASFAFDRSRRVWALREWPESDKQILVDSDPDPDGDDYVRCIYGTGDYTHDTFDDIAVSCRTKAVETGTTIKETATLYTGSPSGVGRKTLTGDDARKLRITLCRQKPADTQCR